MTVKTLVRRKLKSNRYDRPITGYIYQNGVAVAETEKYKGHYITMWYFAPYDTRMHDSDVWRIVLHNTSLLLIGKIDRVSFFPGNSSDETKRNGIEMNYTEIHFSNGTHIGFNEQKLPGSDSFYHAEIAAQGVGPWADLFMPIDRIEPFGVNSKTIIIEP